MAREEANKALINKRRIIKRRTRTGCLTCRKRRIKCDERKPTCFNCERSKKSCLGYQDLSKLPPRKRNRDTSLDLPDGNQQQQQQQQNQQSIVGGAGNVVMSLIMKHIKLLRSSDLQPIQEILI
ncbi:Fungal Zn(2)-Cys(6) binuclear cluster domain family protein [Candida albicans]|uniref:Fungal Zn(2)-Cys(6) binuclear cluster domain family protein n=1 Tax=Candida albicans TaxID=5476 RepID=A0A8H6C4L5_CANAX|nr:Fungal Zn(2)-Cys(6) binuclear cluster domain family protein [Candida albicans]